MGRFNRRSKRTSTSAMKRSETDATETVARCQQSRRTYRSCDAARIDRTRQLAVTLRSLLPIRGAAPVRAGAKTWSLHPCCIIHVTPDPLCQGDAVGIRASSSALPLAMIGISPTRSPRSCALIRPSAERPTCCRDRCPSTREAASAASQCDGRCLRRCSSGCI